jgi:hypothetical protein
MMMEEEDSRYAAMRYDFRLFPMTTQPALHPLLGVLGLFLRLF